jgi:hypothetical protein
VGNTMTMGNQGWTIQRCGQHHDNGQSRMDNPEMWAAPWQWAIKDGQSRDVDNTMTMGNQWWTIQRCGQHHDNALQHEDSTKTHHRLFNLWSLATLIHKYTRHLFQIFTKILKQQHTRKWYIVWDFLSFKMLIWMHALYWILEKFLHYSINNLWIKMSAILQNNLLSYIELLHYIHIHMSTIVTVMRFCAVFMLQCSILKDRKSHTIYHFLVCCCFRILVNIWKRCLVYLWIKVARDHKLNNLLINYLSAKIKLQEVHGNSDMSLDGYHVPNVFVNLCFCDFWKISRHNRSHLWDRIHQCVFYWFFFEYLWFRFRVVLNYTISFDISTPALKISKKSMCIVACAKRYFFVSTQITIPFL